MGKEKVTYVTFLERSKWALVNSFWATLIHEDIKPTKIYLLTNKDEDKVKKSKKALKTILKNEENINPPIEVLEIEDETNFAGIGDEIRGICEESDDVVIDITPGSKALSISALIQGMNSGVEKIYYLHIDEVKNADKPYLDIPLTRQIPTEMKGGRHLV